MTEYMSCFNDTFVLPPTAERVHNYVISSVDSCLCYSSPDALYGIMLFSIKLVFCETILGFAVHA